MIAKKTTMENVPDLNIVRTNWSLEDYIHHYSTLGDTEYIKLSRFIKRFEPEGLSAASAVRILGYHDRGTKGGSGAAGVSDKSTNGIRNGKFVFPNGTSHEKTAMEIGDIAEALNIGFTRPLVTAYISYIKPTDNYSHKWMIKNIGRKRVKLISKPKEFAKELNEVYNYRKGSEKKIQFVGVN